MVEAIHGGHNHTVGAGLLKHGVKIIKDRRIAGAAADHLRPQLVGIVNTRQAGALAKILDNRLRIHRQPT